MVDEHKSESNADDAEQRAASPDPTSRENFTIKRDANSTARMETGGTQMRFSFRDHFSDCAARYAERRPVYPPALAAHLASSAPGRSLAWDAGCGSGQMSALLAEFFEQVIATDASAAQLDHAAQIRRVQFRREHAEHTTLADDAVDLIVAAQAAHWFDLPQFYAEVRRVARDGAVLALVSYSNLRIESELDAVIERFYSRTLAAHWPPERAHVDSGYRSMPFPFEELSEPLPEQAQSMSAVWSLEQTLGYIETWSAVRALERSGDRTAFSSFARELGSAWGSPAAHREIRWPLHVRLARLHRNRHASPRSS